MEMAATPGSANWFLAFYRSALGKKAVMALTGIVLFGFVFMHMAGNLKMFMGAEAYNHYAEFLRSAGEPMLPHGAGLWMFRILLLACVTLHIMAATQLTLLNRRARPVAYSRRDAVQLGYAERTMRWSGYLLAIYIIYHLMHFTVGSAHPDFSITNPYSNVIIAFQSVPVVAVYIVANLLLGMHLYHGLWSLFQTLGWNHPRFNSWRRLFAVTFALVVTAGFLAVPIAVLSGLVS
jgi:succinate dehydrogenase / fumarate reductase cytochrome b subunit